MEITENKLKEILTDQRKEYQQFLDELLLQGPMKIEVIGRPLDHHPHL